MKNPPLRSDDAAPGSPATPAAASLRDVNRRLCLTLGRLVAFAEDAHKLDYNEDRVVTWITMTTHDARNAIRDADGGPADPVLVEARKAFNDLLESVFAEHKDDGWCSRTVPDVVVAACLALLHIDDALKAEDPALVEAAEAYRRDKL